MIIAGDIGGTKTNVALFETDGRRIGASQLQQSFPSSQYPSLESILEEFIATHGPQVTHACFGVAGPVLNGRVEASNMAWVVSKDSLAATLKIPRVGLINDLEAMAYGVEDLQPSQLYTLQEGDPARGGHRALIAAGTGLGMASIFWDGASYHPMPSEGGHIDFAPRSEREIELLRYLREKIGGRVSYERVASGIGLPDVYLFMRDRLGYEEPAWLAEEIRNGDASAAISAAALARKCDIAVETLDIFVEAYGAMAGNLGLLVKSLGGVFVGGGIAPKILEKLKDGSFIDAFNDKGRMSYLVRAMPVHVILDDKAPLYGAARCALMNIG